MKKYTFYRYNIIDYRIFLQEHMKICIKCVRMLKFCNIYSANSLTLGILN